MKNSSAARSNCDKDNRAEEVGSVLLVSSAEEDHICLRKMLNRAGWKLNDFYSYSEALASLELHPAAVVITERGTSGNEWRQLLRPAGNDDATPKIIVTYRFSEDSVVRELLDEGAYHVLVKPFHESEVLQAVGFAWLQWRRELKRRNEPISISAQRYHRRTA